MPARRRRAHRRGARPCSIATIVSAATPDVSISRRHRACHARSREPSEMTPNRSGAELLDSGNRFPAVRACAAPQPHEAPEAADLRASTLVPAAEERDEKGCEDQLDVERQRLAAEIQEIEAQL